MKTIIPEKKKYGKRAVMDVLAAKAVKARDDEAKKAKSLLSRLKPKAEPKTYTEPRVPGVNRAAVRKYAKRIRKEAKEEQKKFRRPAMAVENSAPPDYDPAVEADLEKYGKVCKIRTNTTTEDVKDDDTTNM